MVRRDLIDDLAALDMAGWDDALVDELTEIYDADVETIAAIPGVRVLMA